MAKEPAARTVARDVSRSCLDDDERRRLDDRRRAENFPVALRVLPRAIQEDLRAIYDVVRTIDDLGDEPAAAHGAARCLTDDEGAARLAALDAFARDLDRAWSGRASQFAVLSALAPVIARRSLDQSDFLDLVEANRMDQRVRRHPDMASLEAYCQLSAAPIGRLVLAVFDGPRDARTLRRSDEVCTALQIIEHLQDVGEDRRRGRVYLPADVLRGFGVRPEDLDGDSAPVQLRAAIRFMAAGEAARLRSSAPPLLAQLRGWAKIAVAGYAAGGCAALDAIRRCGGDVLGGDCSPRRLDVARHGARLLVGWERR